MNNFKLGEQIVLIKECDNKLINNNEIYIVSWISDKYPIVKIYGITDYWFPISLFDNDINLIRKNKLKNESNI